MYCTLAFRQREWPIYGLILQSLWRAKFTSIIWHHLFGKTGVLTFYKRDGVMCYWKMFFIVSEEYVWQPWQKLSKIPWVQCMPLETVFTGAFLSKTFSQESYHYWIDYSCFGRGSFQTMVTYGLTAIRNLFKLVNSPISQFLWRERGLQTHTTQHSFQKSGASVFCLRTEGPMFLRTYDVIWFWKLYIFSNRRNAVGYHVNFLQMLLAVDWSQSTNVCWGNF